MKPNIGPFVARTGVVSYPQLALLEPRACRVVDVYSTPTHFGACRFVGDQPSALSSVPFDSGSALHIDFPRLA